MKRGRGCRVHRPRRSRDAREPAEPASHIRRLDHGAEQPLGIPPRAGDRQDRADLAWRRPIHGLCVFPPGPVVFEHYTDGIEPHDTHLLMSVSKSLTAAVTRHIPELEGTSFEGCTVQHLLDMRAGSVSIRTTKTTRPATASSSSRSADTSHATAPICLQHPRVDHVPHTPNDREHGSGFRYRAILTDVLGYQVAERAGGMRFSVLFSREIWSKIGTEQQDEELFRSPSPRRRPVHGRKVRTGRVREGPARRCDSRVGDRP